MMRNKPASSMQKTYDECYLICSTAVFFEGQNNEAEALRSWRSALDQIYYHNAYRLPSSYIPKSETEKALFESLKQLENQCKERVDLLEALRQSRKEAQKEDKHYTIRHRLEKGKSVESLPDRSLGWLGDETIPPLRMSELPSASPALPIRPSVIPSKSSDATPKVRTASVPQMYSSPMGMPPVLPVPQNQVSRSPSPDNGRRTMRTTLRSDRKGFKAPRSATNQPRRPAPMKAAGLAWDTQPRVTSQGISKPEYDPTIEARLNATAVRRSVDQSGSADQHDEDSFRVWDNADYSSSSNKRDPSQSGTKATTFGEDGEFSTIGDSVISDKPPVEDSASLDSPPSPPPRSPPPPPPPPHTAPLNPVTKLRSKSPNRLPKPPDISYRREYPAQPPKQQPISATHTPKKVSINTPLNSKPLPQISRKPVGTHSPGDSTILNRSRRKGGSASESDEELQRLATEQRKHPAQNRKGGANDVTPPSTDGESPEEDTPEVAWDKRASHVMKNLPKGVDENAAKQILNEIVVKGDEVHWDDVAGLSAAKKALKEAVVYPFLRPDLFKGLREPARGMLLFGPPGTGKTMLARAVATESKSTFFAISASSLTSKWHGESEKLVRALFALAKVLAPSIIFVDEIDSLLSARSGSSEHEASRRSKTEFLIQWSDLQRAAAGRDPQNDDGDASRVLVLAATNCPWDIDDAARRRFVRRQYIPLPESETREIQLRTLLGHQKHDLNAQNIWRLVKHTEGYSGSDITALAKDAAMGPLRNLGEELLYTPMEKIRPIHMDDFEASLVAIRPSVSKKGLDQFESWAQEFGERGG